MFPVTAACKVIGCKKKNCKAVHTLILNIPKISAVCDYCHKEPKYRYLYTDDFTKLTTHVTVIGEKCFKANKHTKAV
jgi:hypothetical protein